VPRISVAQARQQADAGEAVLVDVRPGAVYEGLHIAGAISMPLDQVSRRYAELPGDKLLIFYCA
jgi:rhodanese-related sulfurtransferase